MPDVDIGLALLWFVVFLFSTTVHEAMHALAALRGGDPTAQRGGQVSLSPLPHIRREPVGMLIVPLLTAFTQGWTIGWASTPYDPRWAARHPRRAALMAAAGPAGNLLLVLLALVVLRAGLAAGFFTPPLLVSIDHLVDATLDGTGWNLVVRILSILLSLNALLVVFNLLPVPPLDGASAIGVVLPERAAARLQQLVATPTFSLVGLLVAWQVFPYLARPIFKAVLWAVN